VVGVEGKEAPLRWLVPCGHVPCWTDGETVGGRCTRLELVVAERLDRHRVAWIGGTGAVVLVPVAVDVPRCDVPRRGEVVCLVLACPCRDRNRIAVVHEALEHGDGEHTDVRDGCVARAPSRRACGRRLCCR
jgi:hypothetical protein